MQSVFISGATSGIGLVTAQKLDALGWKVYGAALPSDDFAPLIDSTSDKLTPLRLDITDSDSLQAVTQQIDSLNAVVNCAGIQVVGALETLNINAIRQQFEVNLFGHLQVIQTLLPLLRQTDSARIVNVSSLMGKVAMPLLGAYSMSKHALEAMSDVLRLELSPWGIHVALVAPGAVQTPMTSSMSDLMQTSRAESPDYEALYDGMTQALQTQEASAVPAAKVADAIIHALTSNKPKTRYIVGASTKGLIAMRTYAPDTIGDSILKRALGIQNIES